MFDGNDGRETRYLGCEVGLFVFGALKLGSGGVVCQVHGDELFVDQVELGLMHKELGFCGLFRCEGLGVAGICFVIQCPIVRMALTILRSAGSVVPGLFIRLCLELDVNAPADLIVFKGSGVFGRGDNCGVGVDSR